MHSDDTCLERLLLDHCSSSLQARVGISRVLPEEHTPTGMWTSHRSQAEAKCCHGLGCCY